MTSDQPQLGPIQSQERILLLDVLRAVAILGMFYMNTGIFGGYGGGGFQELLNDTIYLLTASKFWPLFLMLMGVGMGIQLQRAEVRGTDIFPTYLRRILFLYVFGASLSLVLPVDHLVHLAMAGLVGLFIAYPFRHRRFLLLGITIWMFLGSAIPAATTAYERAYNNPPTVRATEQTEAREQRSPEAQKRVSEEAGKVSLPFQSMDIIRRKVERRVTDGFPREFKTLRDVVTSAMAWLPYLLFGFFLWQIGLFERSSEQRRLLIRLLVIFGTIGLAAVICDEVLLNQRNAYILRGLGEPPPPSMAAVRSLCDPLGSIGLPVAYISLVALLLPTKWLGGILRKMAPAGRMAFTNYLLHWTLPPILFPLLFAWWLPETGDAEGLLKVTGVFILMVLFSTWWLKRFRFGPFEWLWRSLTYWKLQPMRVERSVPAD